VSHKKKNRPEDNTPADEAGVQAFLAQYHEVAEELHASADVQQVEAILPGSDELAETTQLALMKSLGKEHHSDAADILTAFNECSPIKSVRKEARRSLIRLQEQRIYPEWSVPIAPALTLDELIESELAALNSPELTELEEGEENDDFDLDLAADEVVSEFIEALAEQDFIFAYNLLAADSSLREGLTQEEWIRRREEWAEVALPQRLESSFLFEREPQQGAMWLPRSFEQAAAGMRTEIESGWSLELAASPAASQLPEIPQPTIVYTETGRQWYWTRHTLVREEGRWRIAHMTNEGLKARSLAREELQQRIKEHDAHISEITAQHRPDDPDADRNIDEIMWRSLQVVHYDDALLRQMPLERSLYLDAAGRAVLLGEAELGLVYLEQVAQTFADLRADTLRQVAALRMQLSQDYYSEDEGDGGDDESEEDQERSERFQALAEDALRQSLAIEKNIMSYLMLSQTLLESGDENKFDEAEDLLNQARALTLSPSEEASVATTLGEVYIQRDEYSKALDQYRRAVALVADFPSGWYNVGRAHRLLEQDDEAITAFKRAIEMQPDDMESYAELTDIYLQRDQLSAVRSLLKEGREANPDSAHLLVLLASTYMETDIRHAEELLDEAEEIDPDLELVQLYRQMLNLLKSEQRPGKHRKKR
jgi:tetratricopeptide (TPR) repeat protein